MELTYYQKNKDTLNFKRREYRKTDEGKKRKKIDKWIERGLIATKEEMEFIYLTWKSQYHCSVCGVILTRDGQSGTTCCMDHDHKTGEYRQILCKACNCKDSWIKKKKMLESNISKE
tara:strand:+ start:1943 stop:2293 length:351 start_codon:yes stop_codon:yes gene_type:complete